MKVLLATSLFATAVLPRVALFADGSEIDTHLYLATSSWEPIAFNISSVPKTFSTSSAIETPHVDMELSEIKGIDCDASDETLYITDPNNAVYSIGAIGGALTKLDSTAGEISPFDIKVDPDGRRIFIASMDDGVWSASLDNVTEPAKQLYGGLGGTTGVDYDPSTDMLYFSGNRSPGKIYAGKADGTTAVDDLVFFEDAGNVFQVAIDSWEGKVYWVDSGTEPRSGRIMMGGLDGAGDPAPLFTGLDWPWAIEFDPASGELYWSEPGGGEEGGSLKIVRAQPAVGAEKVELNVGKDVFGLTVCARDWLEPASKKRKKPKKNTSGSVRPKLFIGLKTLSSIFAVLALVVLV